jgi:hypothetical protein
MTRTGAVQISSHHAGATLSAPQKRFNTLIRQIEQARQTLAAWHDNVAAYRLAYGQVLRPLQEELIAGHRQWVFALDAALEQRHWTKAERATLRELLCIAASDLLNTDGEDAEVKAVFDKHSEVDYDTEQRDNMLMMKSLTEAMTGLDFGDDQEIKTEEDLFQRMEQRMREQAAARQAAGEASHRDAKPGRRRKSAAQQRREAEEQQVTQSVREIYRKLASALHPDRETDAQQREEKTVLMQQVNQAYAANDLLTLLELQLRIEQIDASHIANVSAERLKHYNKVLAEQLAEIKAEVDRTEFDFRAEFDVEYEYHSKMDPRKLGFLLEQTRLQWRVDLSEQQRDMRRLSDVPAAKRWLKRQKQMLREDEEFDFFDDPF